MEQLSKLEVGNALEGIAPDLDRVEQLMREISEGGTSFLTESATYLTKAGGKRVRPALMILSSNLGSGPNDDVFKIAAAAEITHLATLYHDDVIDEADTRRGVQSANDRWGNKVAILAGDFLFARASYLAAEVGGVAPRTLAEAIAKVVEGQVEELQATYDPNRTVEHYFKTVEGKTASLLEVCATIGTSLGGCPREVVDTMGRFGLAFGFAFQVADDLLDLVASLDELGKPPGTDMRDGVYTLPVILAVKSDPSIADLLGKPSDDVDDIRSAVLSSGGFEEALDVAMSYVRAGLEALEAVPEGDARTALENLTRLVVERVPALK